MNEHQSCSESSRRSASARPIEDPTSPPIKPLPPAWAPIGSYISTHKFASEESQHTSNPNSPRSSIGSFPKFLRATNSLVPSPRRSIQPHPTLPHRGTDESQLGNHLWLLFCNVLPSVLLSILCIALKEAANLLQRLANSLQASGNTKLEPSRPNHPHTAESSLSSTPNFRRILSTPTASLSSTKSELQNDLNGRKSNRSSNTHRHSNSRQSRHQSLKHLLEELAIELTHSQSPLQAGDAMARHMIAKRNVVLPEEPFCSPPIMPSPPSDVDHFQEASRKSWSNGKKLTRVEQNVPLAVEVDKEDDHSSSSVAVTTKFVGEDVTHAEHQDCIYETVDEAAPPSLDFMSPLVLALSSSPATEKTETMSRIDSPIHLPPPLPGSQGEMLVHEDHMKDSESDRDSVDRDSVIGARRVLSTSERSRSDATNSPLAFEKSPSLTLQNPSLVEDYDSDQMIVPIRAMKSEKTDKNLEAPNYLELLKSANESSPPMPNHSTPVGCVEAQLTEKDVRCAIEPVNDENDVLWSRAARIYEERKDPDDLSSIDREIKAYLHEKSLIKEGSRTPFLNTRERSGLGTSPTQAVQHASIFRSDEVHRSRENRLSKGIPLQNVGRSQSTAEKPIGDWTEITPYEANKESRLSRRHLSDLSFGVRERQKDMLPKELIPDDFRTDDEFTDLDEPVVDRLGGKKWKRGIIAACKDVSECRKMVANLWKRRRNGTPIEEGLSGPQRMYRVDSHRSQTRRSGPHEIGVKFDSTLSQDTVFRLLDRLCPDIGVSVVARKPNHKLKVTVSIPGQNRPLLLSIHLTRQSHSRGTTVVLARSKDDQSGAARKHIEITGLSLRQKLEENLEFIEDSFSSRLLEDSRL